MNWARLPWYTPVQWHFRRWRVVRLRRVLLVLRVGKEVLGSLMGVLLRVVVVVVRVVRG